MIIKKNILYIAAILLIVLVAGYFLIQGDSSSSSQKNNLENTNGNYQEVVIGMRNYNYYPNTVTVKSGIPVRLSLNEEVVGCFRDLSIRDFNIRKYLQTPNDYVEFTPEKPGMYRFACSMGMGYGNLVVE